MACRPIAALLSLACVAVPVARGAAGIATIAVSDAEIRIEPAPGNPGSGHLVALEFGDEYTGDCGWALAPGGGGAISLAACEFLSLSFVPPTASFGPTLTAPEPVNADEVRYAAMRIRVSAGAAVPIRISGGSGFIDLSATADGSWHTLRADLAALPGWSGPQTVTVAVGVGGAYPAYQGRTVDIDWIAINDSNGYAGGLDYTRFDRTWDLGFPTPVFSGNIAAPILLDRFDGPVDRMYRRFQLVDHAHNPIGGAHYVDDWSGVSYLIDGRSHRTPLPLATGINGVEDYQPADFATLQPNCGKLNTVLASFVDRSPTPAFTWTVDGVDIGLKKPQIDALIAKIKTLNELGMTMYLVMLNTSADAVPASDDFLWPETAVPGSGNWVGHNSFDPLGRLVVRAFFEYLSYRLSLPGESSVNGFILGNEVDAHPVWHQVGPLSEEAFIAYHAYLLRLADLSIRKYHPEARVLISLTHFWGNAFTVSPKTLLETTDALIEAEGDFPWGLAQHPYPRNLFDPTWWDDNGATLSLDTDYITYRNIEVTPQILAQDAFRYRGAERYLSFSEQGFHTPNQAVQAAAYAYAYRKMIRIPQLRSHVMHRYQDHPNEGGLLLGLRDLSGTPKESYTLFQHANSPAWANWFDPYLPLLPITSWDEAVPTWGSYHFNFNEAGFHEGWTAAHQITGLQVQGGLLSGQTTSGDPRLEIQSFFAHTDAARRLLIRMRCDTHGAAQLFWHAAGQGFSEGRSTTFPLIGDNQFHLYEISPDWDHTLVTGLRFDPVNAPGASFAIDFICAGQFTDFDSDGIPDAVEGDATVDSDGDSLPDFADPDSDGDTISDRFETTRDTDGDTVPDYLDLDSDWDGASDQAERIAGTPIYATDEDNDGLENKDEQPGDADGDGIPNQADPDADGDGTRDGDEATSGRDPFAPFDLAFEYNQDGDFERWDDILNNLAGAAVSGGTLHATATSGDPQLVHQGFQFNGSDVSAIAVRMKADVNDIAQLFWAREGAGLFAPARRLDADYTGNGDWAVLTFDGTAHPEWMGETITQLRLDPTKASGASFDIDWVRHADGDLDDDGISDTAEGTADSDNDGTPDFLDRNSDDDPQTDAEEFVAGTSTTDPADFFRVAGIVPATGIVVQVEAKPGRTYVLERSEAQHTNQWIEVLTVPSPGDQLLSLPDAGNTNSAAYRVGVTN